MNTLTVCGVELRKVETPKDARGKSWAEYRGASPDLTFCIWQAHSDCVEWYGTAIVTATWAGGMKSERRQIASAGGTSAESCAETLGEMVRSVARALGSVA